MTSVEKQPALDYHAYLVAGGRESLSWLKEQFVIERKKWLAGGEPEPEFVVREESSWGIENSREFRALQTSRWQAGRRWLVIVCDQMMIEAEQALLKTLEEPAQGVQIFIILPQPDKLLPTVRSRCQVIYPEKVGGDNFSVGDKFLSLSRSERLTEMEKILSRDDSRNELERLLTNIEQSIGEKKERDSRLALIRRLLLARQWIRRAHVSPKFVGQFLAVTLPRYSK